MAAKGVGVMELEAVDHYDVNHAVIPSGPMGRWAAGLGIKHT